MKNKLLLLNRLASWWRTDMEHVWTSVTTQRPSPFSR